MLVSTKLVAGHCYALTYQPVSLEMVHLLPELWKSWSVISTIRPVATGVCVGRENTCNDDKWECFLCGGSSHLCEAKFKAHPTYVYSDLWLKFYTCLYYTWIEPGIMWIVDGESWNHEKIIRFQIWFPKRDSDNSSRMFSWTWVSLYNSPGLSQGKCLPSYLATTFMKQKGKVIIYVYFRSLTGIADKLKNLVN